MSKTKLSNKRKRQNDATEDGAPKSSKKVKQVDDSDAVESLAAPAEAAPAPSKEAKSKKSKKSKSFSDASKTVDDELATNGTSDPTAADGNDEVMPNAPDATAATTTSKKSKKDKKDKKDKKSKKKADQVSESTEEQTNGVSEDVDVEMADGETVTPKKKAKKERKREKKDKRAKKAADQTEPSQEGKENSEVAPEVNGDADHEAPTAAKSKKDKKGKKEGEQGPIEAIAQGTEVAEGQVESGEQPGAGGDDTEKKGRFIVFVGNLPYSATREQIEAHFEKLKPFELRMRTYKNKKDGKVGGFMGTCFIEFPRYDRMQTALQKYHHSVFSNGEGPKNERKINVELSAGGGGNNPARMEKIKAKNEKLANERQRKHEKREEIESKQKERKEKKAARGVNGASAEDETKEEPAEENGGMHPSRLALLNMPAPQWKPRKRF